MGPLASFRIIEFAGIGPGPFCAMLLGDLGADVIRIDRPGGEEFSVQKPERNPLLRNRRSIFLDLKSTEGVEDALRLIETADASIEGFRPGVMERLGLGPDACLARNPHLVYGRMTGFGQEGPLAQSAGHDINYIALTGALHAIGPAGGRPTPPLNLVGDFGGGALYLALGLLAAMLECGRSGKGQVVDAAMVDGAASLMTMAYGAHADGLWRDERGANVLDGGAPFYDTYQTRDGAWMAVGALEPKFFAKLAARLGLERRFVEGQRDRALWPEMRAELSRLFAAKSRAEWAEVFEQDDCCVTGVYSMADAPAHAHSVARAAFVDVGGMVQPAPAPRFSRTKTETPAPPCASGAHTTETLSELGARRGKHDQEEAQ